MNKGQLKNIWTRQKWGGLMTAHQSAILIANMGIQGAISCGLRRQVTILSQEAWERVMAGLKCDLPPQTRRANLMVKGIDLKKSKGKVLTIGECQLLIMGETTPCEAMEAKQIGLQKALEPDWNGGVFARVINGGTIKLNDYVYWSEGNE